jgi:hypothetical protein
VYLVHIIASKYQISHIKRERENRSQSIVHSEHLFQSCFCGLKLCWMMNRRMFEREKRERKEERGEREIPQYWVVSYRICWRGSQQWSEIRVPSLQTCSILKWGSETKWPTLLFPDNIQHNNSIFPKTKSCQLILFLVKKNDTPSQWGVTEPLIYLCFWTCKSTFIKNRCNVSKKTSIVQNFGLSEVAQCWYR